VYQSVSFVGPNENGLFRQILYTVILFMEVHLSTLYPALIIKLYLVFSENKLMGAAKTSPRICMKHAQNK